MEFSFVFASGRMVVQGETRDADNRLYHLDLPRHVGLRTAVTGQVDNKVVSITMVDVLGALRALHGDANAFRASGSAAQLAGSLGQTLEAGRSIIQRIESDIEGRFFLDGAGHITERAGRVRLPYAATAPSREGTVTKNFVGLEEAEKWLQRRRAATMLGFAYSRCDELLDGEDSPTLDEFLAVAAFYGEAPSIALGDAQ
jgi:hypothetical protein